MDLHPNVPTLRPSLPEVDEAWLKELAASPHDAFVKKVFSDPATAAAFFQNHLSPEIVASIDWTTLTLQSASFVKRELSQSHSDLLFSANRNGELVLIYLLLEHQTTVDRSMRLRLMGYMSQIWLRHQEQHPQAPLPIVIPFVLHQGPTEWALSVHFEDQFQLPKSADQLLEFIPKFRHALLDLTKCDPRTEEQHTTIQISLALMQQARRHQDLLTFFAWLQANHPTISLNFYRLLLLYALHVDTALDVETLLRETLTSQHLRETTMTTAALLEAKGEVRGEAKGEARGEARGKNVGRLIGGIGILEKVLQLPATPLVVLESLSLEALEETFHRLDAQFEARAKV